jgi:UDP-N-acetylmuramate--alanine ligase
MVIDDYAHHPTEIMAVLKAAKNGWNRRLISIFQPQRFTRTKLLMNEFAKAFDDADIAVIADIYYEGTGEEPIEGVNSEKLARLVEEHWRAINKQGVIIHIGHLSEITSYLKSICRRGDLIITMGAGNIYEVAKQLTSEIEVVLQGGGVC